MTERNENLNWCPKGWGWLIGDCDYSKDCEDCPIPRKGKGVNI